MGMLHNFSETEPENITAGLMWIRPSTGKTYMYLDGVWGEVAGQTAGISFGIPLTIFIRGIDRTQNIDCNTFGKADALTKEIDTCDFTLFDYNNDIKPTEGEEIIVFYKPTDVSTPEKVFGGEIVSAPQRVTAPGQLSYEYDIGCADYSKKLQKSLVVESYTSMLAGNIIKDLVDTYGDEFTTYNVADGITIDSITFNYMTLEQCISELAELTGYDWYVDYERDIHFFVEETATAPYSLTENINTTGNYKDLLIRVDKSQLRNSVTVRGGTYLSDLFEQLRVADGEQLSFNLDYYPRAPISAYVDTGTGYVQKTVGIDNVHTSGFDFVVNYNEKVIKNLDLAKLSSGDKIKITYKYDVQVLVQSRNDDSINFMKQIEGGSGTYEYIIKDTAIEDLEVARNRAEVELEKYASPSIKGSFSTDQNGYRSGQVLTLEMPERGYDSNKFLIEKVSAQLKNDNKFEYDITFSNPLTKSFEKFLIDLLDGSKEIIVRENEILHKLAVVEAETITLTTTVATDVKQTPPFQWGPGGSPQAKWNEFQWN